MTSNNKEGLSHLLFYTNDGTDLNSWGKGEKAPVFSSENSSKGSSEKEKTFSDAELCSWANKDYLKKDHSVDTGASIRSISDGNREITITDSTGKVLDKYTVDPKTGKGTNSAGETVDLPQTGCNSMTNLLAVFGALAMIVFGAFAVKASGVLRRREDI